jgi:hypothetical protein
MVVWYLQRARYRILFNPSSFTKCDQPLVLFDTKISLCTAAINAERYILLFVSHINILQTRLLITDKPSLQNPHIVVTLVIDLQTLLKQAGVLDKNFPVATLV